VVDRYWIHAERKTGGSYPDHTERGGKWMLFVKSSETDSWWADQDGNGVRPIGQQR